MSAARRRVYEAGERLVRQGDDAEVLLLLESGRVAVRLVTPGGDSVTLAVLGPGDVFGEVGLVSRRHERTATVQALDAVAVRSIRRDDFDRLREGHPEVNDFLLQLMARTVDKLSRLVVEAHHLPVDKRVTRRLYELGRLYGQEAPPLVLPLTQDEIAQIAGATRPTVNQVLKRLEAEHIVRLTRGQIAILDLPRLKRRCSW